MTPRPVIAADPTIDPLADIGTYDYDLRTRELFWSDAFRKICGVPLSEPLTAESPLRFCHPDDTGLMRAGAAEALASGRADFEYRTVRPDGEVRKLFVRANLVRDDAGEPARLVGLAIDVTRRHEIDESLRCSERRYRTFAQASAHVIWVARANGSVVEVSDRWEALTGHPKEAASGHVFMSLIVPEDLAPIREDWLRAIAEGRPYEAGSGSGAPTARCCTCGAAACRCWMRPAGSSNASACSPTSPRHARPKRRAKRRRSASAACRRPRSKAS
jgi:PAS domain S-box-containing protein